ncbi:LPS-assembly protein LptD [Sporomusa malonica]|uniref:LPS-assembly protein n=1 Tax=Sporomusa malonica TaxID=112901 RepID=A0A1W1YRZ7_9FIRM|nr:LPS-assembly protein LptD [Sporomusa malonica]SMC38985.1 LPS-assembly protein [Sporomusa malonica]
MPNNNKIILGLMAFAIVFGGANQSQAQETKPKQAITSQAPIVIEANDLSFSDETGEILAKGNVVITNDGRRVEAEQVNGNTKLSEIWVKDKALFSEPGKTLTGINTLYNYKLKTGSMDKAKGKVEKSYISGNNISMFPDKLIINDGTATNCPATVPDYHISADKIEIWPGNKMIAYNAKFWIGNMVIFSLPKYQQSLTPENDSVVFPQLGYDSDDGVFIKQRIEYPFNNKLAAYVNLDYYSRAHFKPNYGLIDRESNYSVGISQGHFSDDDSNWIKKEPEFKFSYYPHRLGKLPVSYTFTAAYGKWSDSQKTSWHQDYSLYFKHDTIKLGESVTLNIGTGIQHVRESYDDSRRDMWKFDATVDKKWSERLNTWVGYHYTQNNDALFEYDQTDLSRELASGFTYKIDKMNAIGVSHSYDLDNDKVADIDYSWYRNLHCWEAKVTYRAKRDQIRFDVSTVKW